MNKNCFIFILTFLYFNLFTIFTNINQNFKNNNLIIKHKQKRSNQTELENYKILNILLKNYDKRVRPLTFNYLNNSGIFFMFIKEKIVFFFLVDPVLVKVNILIRMLSKIDVVNMVYYLFFI